MKDLKKIIKNFSQARIMVLGDLILDEYIWGDVQRISPEAPVPVVSAKRRSYVLGGAANAANNIKSLGADVCLCGVVGRDKNTEILLSQLKKQGIGREGVLAVNKRHTTVKTRIIASHQQVVRLDWEHTDLLTKSINAKLYDFIDQNISKFQAIVIEDYGKGVINHGLIKRVIGLARTKSRIITVDPKEEHFQYYCGTTSITPNRKEAESAVRNLKIQDTTNTFKINTDNLMTDKVLRRAGKELLRYLKLDSLLITLGEEGMYLFEDSQITHIPTQAQEVFDVSGAGDTVIAAFTLSMACGASKLEAAHIANFAAGIVVSKIGTATVSSGELTKRLSKI
ncbi:MAG: D-glycero-beta-D-manno-heptose-7-phosphate kinase [Candidatus Aminicenantes bacterium]|nr:D-glycero-beta-D-manno-heptose-7-phosphate kinase [Candidatus Aminicenantes bacterium]